MMKELFEDILGTFENEDIKKFAKNCLNAAPKYWYSVPASSSGKFHPAYALGDGGLVRHTIALIKCLNHMFEIESISSQFTSRERDLLRVAGLAHDMWKSGSQEDYEKSKFTKFEHPLLAARAVQNIDGLNKDEKIFIGKVIASHMGAFNTSKRSSVVLPKPEDKYQIILHLADYLASRKDIEIKFDKQNEEATLETYRFPFGKYSGMTIPEVMEKNPGYIKWAKENMESEPARTLLKQVEV